MKSKLLIFFFLVFAINLYSQNSSKSTVTPDPRLYEALGKDNVEFLLQNNPDIIEYYNFYLDNAFALVQHATEKIPSIVQNYPKLELKNASLTYDKPDISKGAKSINILKYIYKLQPDESSTYWIDKSGIAVVFYSSKTITENYNKIKTH
ncbi:MAG: hypothetical protein WC599_04465 [Bacteroidales bacterium]